MSETRPPDQPDTPPTARFSWSKLKLGAAVLSVASGLTVASQFFEGVPRVLDGVEKTRTSINRIRGRQPYEVEVRYLKQLPRSLANVMASQESLHWIWVSAENRRAEPLHVTVQAEVSGPAIPAGLITADRQTIGPGKKLERSVHVAIPWAKSDFKGDEVLKVTWFVLDDKKSLLWQKDDNIPVLPREIVPWGLRSAKGEAVSLDFLVASLTAWAITPEPAIEAAAREMLKAVEAEPDERIRARRWMATASERLFAGPTAVKVHGRAAKFPPSQQEQVRTPAGVLKERRANALEAALLVAAHRMALARDLRARLTLLAVPVSAQNSAKDLLLAWSPDGREWEAIDLRQVGTTAFDANRTAATARARPLLEDAEISKALAERGVLVDDKRQVVALAFQRAQKFYGIRPLP